MGGREKFFNESYMSMIKVWSSMKRNYFRVEFAIGALCLLLLLVIVWSCNIASRELIGSCSGFQLPFLYIANLTPYLIGFLIAVVFGDFASTTIVEEMWAYLGIKESRHKRFLIRYHGQGQLVGVVERALYYAALLAGQTLFVSVWFTLKTVSRSPRWGEKGPIQGRGIFQPFLVGSGLSLLFSAGGFFVANLLLGQGAMRLKLAGLLGISLTLFLVWLYCWGISRWAVNEAIREKEKKRKRRRRRRK